MGVKVRAPRVADQQGVARQGEPGVVATRPVRHDVGVVGGSVPGRGDRAQLGVAELDDLAVGQGDVLEVDTGALREVRGRAGALDQRRQSRDVVCLNVCLQHRDDRHALRLRDPDVIVDEIRVRSTTAKRSFVLQPNR